MENPFQMQLSSLLEAANTDLRRLDALLYICCTQASQHCPFKQKACDQHCLANIEMAEKASSAQ